MIRSAPAAPPLPAAGALLAWYDGHARVLPWRVGPAARRAGVRPDPYRVWLSEIMLQQTTVKAVAPYFAAFLERWPTITALAAAPEAEVMSAWAGLGYYARARNLKACAERIAREHGGRFPETEAGLRALPGIGAYTAAAIAAIAFERAAVVVDGNVERVVARLFAVTEPLPAARRRLHLRAALIAPAARHGDFAQAMMDLGATICTPAKPGCALCPWSDPCLARAEGRPEIYPVKAPRAARPVRYGVAYVAVRADGAVLLTRRAPSGLLGGMSGPPTSAWGGEPPAPEAVTATAPLPAAWTALPEPVRHGFTHFELVQTVMKGDVGRDTAAPPGTWWSEPDALAGEAIPTVFTKVFSAALGCPTRRGRSDGRAAALPRARS